MGECRSPQDFLERRDQPRQAREAACKCQESGAPAGQPLLLQKCLGGGMLTKLAERECVQKMRSRRPPALEEPAEQDERPLGLFVKHRRSDGHQQELPVRGTRRNRLLGERQERQTGIGLRERLDEPIGPYTGRI